MPEIDFEARQAWFEAHLDGLAAAGARILVAERNGISCGFVTVDPRLRYLDQLAVHPAHQGGGIAHRLLEGAKGLSPEGLALDVNAANTPARRLYARHGFRTVSAGVNLRSGLPTLRLRWRGLDKDRSAVDDIAVIDNK